MWVPECTCIIMGVRACVRATARVYMRACYVSVHARMCACKRGRVYSVIHHRGAAINAQPTINPKNDLYSITSGGISLWNMDVSYFCRRNSITCH